MNIRSAKLAESLDRNAVRSVSKLLLTAVWVVFVLYLFTLLPGIDRIVPRTPVTFLAVVSAVATLVVVGLLCFAAPRIAALLRTGIGGPKAIVEHVAAAAYWVVVLVAVLVAHRGLAGAITPFFDGVVWLYDAVFLLAALPVVVVIGARLYASLGPGSDRIADRIVDSDRDEGNEDTEGTTTRS